VNGPQADAAAIVLASPARRTGFTLLEVMVAIVLTSIVVAVAYAMTQAGIDARTRLTTHLRAAQSTRAAREILRDAIRNARAAQSAGDPRGGVVLSNDTLSFVAAGGASPLDPDYDWRFSIAPGRGGLNVAATALGHAQPATVTFTIPDITRWSVWMLAPDGHTWRTDWTEPVLMPRAVVIGFWNGNHLSGLPLHIALWPGESPALADSLPALSAASPGDIR
jgi:prepilin-type N-terminal cleavage/methylation domain-containing protein